jgi:hypothetical protein
VSVLSLRHREPAQQVLFALAPVLELEGQAGEGRRASERRVLEATHTVLSPCAVVFRPRVPARAALGARAARRLGPSMTI